MESQNQDAKHIENKEARETWGCLDGNQRERVQAVYREKSREHLIE